MSNTVFQIRRSNTSATPGTTLNSGELAYSFNSNALFIGAQTGVGTAGFKVGGAAFQYISGVTPGTVNATAAVIVDANLFSSAIYTQSLAVQAASAAVPTVTIASISNSGSGGNLGANASGGGIGTELATTAAISAWVTGKLGGSTVGGGNTNVQFDNSGAFGGSAGLTFINTTNTFFVGNTITAGAGPNFTANNTLVNAAALNVVAQTNTATLFVTTSANVGTAFTANSTLANAIALNVVNQTNTATFFAATSANVGANVQATTTALTILANAIVNSVVNTTSNSILNGTSLDISYWNGNSTVNTTSNTFVNASVVLVGNSLVNSTQNSTAFSAGANSFLSTSQLFISANVVVSGVVNTTVNTIATGGTLTLSYWNGNSTVNVYSNTFVNSTVMIIGNSTVNSIVNATNFNATANNALNLGGVVAAAYVQNTFTGTLTGNVTLGGTNTVFSSNATFSANAVFSGANVWLASTNTFSSSNTTLAGTNTVITSNTTFTGGLITATSSNLSIQNISVTGNLTVSGTVTTINTSELIVNSNFIQLADLNKTTDTVDEGFFGTVGNSTVTYYPGIVRVASLGTLQNPYFYVFSTKNNPNTASTIDLSAANTFTGTLQAYLNPYGGAGAFIANSTVVNITANSTVSSALVANSLTLTTALGAGSGGTGQEGGFTAGDMLYASAATTLSKLNVGSTNGYVMQVTSNLPAWGVLDGGTF